MTQSKQSINVKYYFLLFSCEAGLFLSLSSCLVETKIWNDGLITAQAGRFLNSCLVIKMVWNKRLVTAQASKTLLNRQQLVLTDPEGVTLIPLGFPFCTCCLLLWFSIIQNRAGTCHQAGKGMKMVTHSRAIREGEVFSRQRFSLWSSASFFCLSPSPCMMFLITAFFSHHLVLLFLFYLPNALNRYRRPEIQTTC